MPVKKSSALVFLALILCANISFAQLKFFDGFIVDQKGEYVYGYIAFDENAGKGCTFKRTLDAEAKFLTPADITAFGKINENIFRKKTLQLPDGIIEVFMEELVDGLNKLYAFDGRYYVDRTNDFIEIRDAASELENSRKRLSEIVNDNPKLKKKALKLSINAASLAGLITEFNIWATGIVPTHYRKLTDGSETLRPTILEIGGLLGVDWTDVSIRGADRFNFNRSYVDLSTFHTGLSLRYSPASTKYIGFGTGVEYYSERIQTVVDFNDDEHIYLLKSDFSSFQIPIYIRAHRFLTGAWDPYIMVGSRITIPMKKSIILEEDIVSENTIYFNRYQDDSIRQPSYLFFALGVNYRLNENLYCFAQAVKSTGKRDLKGAIPYFASTSYTVKSSMIQFGISYVLEKK